MEQTFSGAPALFWVRAWHFVHEDPSALDAALREEAPPRSEDRDRLERDESFYWGLAPGGL